LTGRQPRLGESLRLCRRYRPATTIVSHGKRSKARAARMLAGALFHRLAEIEHERTVGENRRTRIVQNVGLATSTEALEWLPKTRVQSTMTYGKLEPS
jgi:hypothetical protein